MSPSTASGSRAARSRSVIALAISAIVLLVAVLVALSGPNNGKQKVSPTPPAISSRPFAVDSVWNAALPTDPPLSPMSATYVSELAQQVARYGPWINTTQYSTPVYTVSPTQPLVPVTLDTHGGSAGELASELRHGVPIPSGARPAAGTDQHMVVWQPKRNTIWEFWGARDENGVWHARWGGEITDVSRSPGYYTTHSDWGATATSLPLLGGLIRISELRAHRIDHALALAIPQAAASAFAFPAQRSDGVGKSPTAIPEGTRFRLDPRLDVSAMKVPAITKIIALAAQRYGMIVRDQSGVVSLYAEDPRPTGSNPYAGPTGFFEGLYPSQVLRYFPWSHLEVLSAPTTKR